MDLSRARPGLAALLRRAHAGLPGGLVLDDRAWARRHGVVVGVVLLHVPALAVLALVVGGGRHTVAEVGAVLGVGLLATVPVLSRVVRSVLAAAGLVGCSSVLVHLTGGATEAHFHFFAVVALLPLYQAWPPLLAAVLLVFLEHGVVGVLRPAAVFEHGHADPWLWAGLHSVATLAVTAACVSAWWVNELDHRQLRDQRDLARRQREDALRHLALHDPLTGLPNRLLLEDRLQQALAGEERRGRRTALLFLDLDGFKAVNDDRGHAAGDALLCRAAGAVTRALRPGDCAARVGGDEFVVVCPDMAGPADAEATAARLGAVVREELRGDGVDVSVGLAVSDAGSTAHSLLVAADRAMYAVKRARVPGQRAAAGRLTATAAAP